MMADQLLEKGVRLDGQYYCPHHPQATVERYRRKCDCRKPALGLYKQAISELNIDLKVSYAIGDKIRDCAICETTLCRGFLIGSNEQKVTIEAVKRGRYQRIDYADSLLTCAQWILTHPEKIED